MEKIAGIFLLIVFISLNRTDLYGVGGGGSYDPTLNIQWWRDWDASYNYLPGVNGRPPHKMWTVGKIDNRLDGPPASADTSITNINLIFAYEKDKIAQLIQAGYIGNYWEIANEPNWWPYFTPENYAYEFHLYCTELKRLDATAKCVSGGIGLYHSNWTNWIDSFRLSYLQEYGTAPPVDVWGIHPYDVFDENAGQRTIDKIVAFRNYLDNDDIIWITEFGKGNWQPELTENIVDYLITVTDWLNSNHEDYKIERWFWWGVLAGDRGMGSNGLFYKGPYSLVTITPVGEAYLAQRDKRQIIIYLPVIFMLFLIIIYKREAHFFYK